MTEQEPLEKLSEQELSNKITNIENKVDAIYYMLIGTKLTQNILDYKCFYVKINDREENMDDNYCYYYYIAPSGKVFYNVKESEAYTTIAKDKNLNDFVFVDYDESMKFDYLSYARHNSYRKVFIAEDGYIFQNYNNKKGKRNRKKEIKESELDNYYILDISDRDPELKDD